MEVIFLGTGTSQGIPVLTCSCRVCTSNNSKDKRLRTSIAIAKSGHTIIIDVGPDFRQQLLRDDVNDIDAILITHEHNDHIIGLDDIRPFVFKKREGIDFYVTTQVEKEIKMRFPYVFTKHSYPGAPKVNLINFIPGESFNEGPFTILPIEVMHGKLPVTAFKVGNFLYITDASEISEQNMELMKGVDTMVINALRDRPHHSHFSTDQALEIVRKIGPRRAYLTHLSHHQPLHEELEKRLPSHISVAYDGLRIHVD